MICYPVESRREIDIEISNKDIINRILKNLDMWTLRVSLWELNLMFKQATTNSVSLLCHLRNLPKAGSFLASQTYNYDKFLVEEKPATLEVVCSILLSYFLFIESRNIILS